MADSFHTLYKWTREAREKLFRYSEGMGPADYTHETPEMGWNSVRKTHLHVAECYWIWLAKFLGDECPDLSPELYPDVAAVRRVFAGVDELVDRFFVRFADQMETPVTGTVSWQKEPLVVTPLWLLSHTITHEFHHKGQITFLGRQLGHIPPDTDLLLPTES